MLPLHRASLVLIKNNKLLLIRRQKAGETYYVLPGGGLEEGETAEQAVVRETSEELGILVRPIRELTVIQGKNYLTNTLFECEQIDSGEIAWQEEEKQKTDNNYTPEWALLSDLHAYQLKPQETKETILATYF